MGKVLGQTGPEIGCAEGVGEDLEETEDLCHAAEEAKAGSLCSLGRVGIMENVGVLGVPGYLALDDGEAGGIECFLANLLRELVEGVVHGR